MSRVMSEAAPARNLDDEKERGRLRCEFRHGHVHYGQAHSKTQEDYKAVSQNVMHATTGITDQFYSNMDDEEKKNKIDSMFESRTHDENMSDLYKEFMEFQAWKEAKR